MGSCVCIMQLSFPMKAAAVDSHNEHSPLELINQAKRFYSIPQIAKGLDVSPSTVSRWIGGKSHPKPYVTDRLHNLIADHVRRNRSGE